MQFRNLIHMTGILALGLVPLSARAQTPLDRVTLELERTDRRIERAETIVTESNNELAHAQLDQAVSVQANARAALSEGRLRNALDLTYRARTLADRAIALVSGLPDPDRVLAQLERTRELIDRARERIEECNQDRARAMLRVAVDMQGRAEAAAQGGHYLAAIQLTFGARERVHQALRLCNVTENLRDSAERALHRTDEVVQRAREHVRPAGDAARQALARAVDLQGRARLEFRDGRTDASVRLTLSARAFAFRALRLSGSVN